MNLRYDLLAAHVGETFIVVAAAADGTETEIDVVLGEALPGPDEQPGGVLHFFGPTESRLVQGTYSVRHPDIGEGPLFIVPIARSDEAMTYESVFG